MIKPAEPLQRLLDRNLLVDPRSLRPLRLSADGAWLEEPVGGLRYPIEHGIPRLLEELAEPLESR